jgi:carboxypeptidase family protein
VGFEYVFVNGVLALEHDKVTGLMGGRPLRGPGYAMRDYLPEGMPPRGKLQGVVTDTGGYPLPRSSVTLTDASGKVLGTANIKKDGRYEIVLEQPCHGCSLKVERMGFVTQSRSGIEYNGSNPLWFGFAMERRK